VGEKSEARLDKMTMLAFGDTVLLRSMRTRHTMSNAGALKISVETMILTPPVRLN
jgi:hypothetical protein